MQRSTVGLFHAGVAVLAVVLGGCSYGYPSGANGGSAAGGTAGSHEPAGGGQVEVEGGGGSGGVAAEPVPDVPVPDEPIPDEPAPCSAAGVDCWSGVPCCAGTFCAYVDYAVTACVAAAPDGGACGEDEGCLSGRCAGGICRAASCAGTGAPCSQRVDVGCCDGFCTSDGSSYVDGICAAPQPTGSYCEEPHWCLSLACVDWQCL